jgi:putative ATP-binding cassette transporter
MAASSPYPSSGRIRGWLIFLRSFRRLAGPYWRSDPNWVISALTVLLILLTTAQVAIAVAFNAWYEKLFDALEQRALIPFLVLIGILFLIIAVTAGVTTLHLWVKRRIQVGWRNWLTRRLVDEWMTSGRHYQVTQIPGDHDNPDGRIAEDIRIATEYAIDLAHSLLYSLLLLVSFTQILWTLSGPPEVRLGAVEIYLPGHMVWVALVYSAAGSAVALLLGWPLIRAANTRQAAEQNFRFGLVRGRENSLAIALLSGEADERRGLRDLFLDAVAAWHRQTRALVQLMLFSSSWSVLSQVFPILVTAPRYIVGAITLGVLMQTAQAFQQMAAALSWPIDNLSKAAEWRASAERVQRLHDAVDGLTRQVAPPDRPTISVDLSGRPFLTFVDCAIHEPDGRIAVAGFRLAVGPRERVLISGDLGAAVKLFKAVAGLWPWGRGRIGLPSDGDIYFMPQRPYVPLGTLCAAVCYPADPQGCDIDVIHSALRRTGLEEMISRLDDREAWEHTLSSGDLQRLGFARLMIHRPRWIFLQEATSSLDADGQAAMMRLLRDAFPTATVISIGPATELAPFHRRQLSLVRSNQGAHLVEKKAAGRTGAPGPKRR